MICHFELHFADIEQQFDVVFADYFAEELHQLRPMIDDGLVVLSPEGLRVTPAGRLLIRRVCMTFDAYINKSGSEIRYSKII